MNKYIVEFLGTLFFVFIILSVGNPLAIGSALAIVIILGGNISGGHLKNTNGRRVCRPVCSSRLAFVTTAFPIHIPSRVALIQNQPGKNKAQKKTARQKLQALALTKV